MEIDLGWGDADDHLRLPTRRCEWCGDPVVAGFSERFCRRCYDLRTELSTYSHHTRRVVERMIVSQRAQGVAGPEIRLFASEKFRWFRSNATTCDEHEDDRQRRGIKVTRMTPNAVATTKGALVVPLTTIEQAPKFFTIVGLVLRAGGFRVVALAEKRPSEKYLRTLAFPFEELRELEGPEAELHEWKFREVRRLRAAFDPVIWIDADYGRVDPSKDTGIVTFNWAAAVKLGITANGKVGTT